MSSPRKKKNGSDTPPAEPEKAAEEQKPVEAPKEEAAPREPDIKLVVMRPNPTPGMLNGRPSEYSEEIAEKILDMLVDGATFDNIDADKEMPCRRTIARWRRRMPQFHQDCMDAVRLSVLHLEQRALAIANATTPEDVAASRMKVGTHFELANRWGGRISKMDGAIEKAEAKAAAAAVTAGGEYAKVIDGTYELVAMEKPKRFEDAIKDFEKKTGLKSNHTRELEAEAAKSKPAE